MAKLIENHIKSKDVNVITDNGIVAFLGDGKKLTGIKLANGAEIPCQLAVVAIGVRPNVKIAREAGLAIGKKGGVLVDAYMQTSDENIYAVGDCVETKNLLTGEMIHAPFGDLANLQGRVAGENAITGNKVTFPGTIQTGICKIFDYTAGTTGLNERTAIKFGFDVITVINASLDKPGFMNGKSLITKLIADRNNGKILGAQCVGAGDVNKQIAQWAMAIMAGFTVADVINVDLPYAPPFSLALDHFIATAHIMQNKMLSRLKGISAQEVKKLLDDKVKITLLDIRDFAEYEAVRLGAGEILVPLGALRKRLSELPQDKDALIITYCRISLRGYEAALILEANGWNNVRVMEGGLMAWPYARER